MSYQNIPGISDKFERDCEERWDMIQPELPAAGVVVDIGAAEGYFVKQIAEQTDLLAVGIEKQKGRVLFQRRWLTEEHLGKVVSCHCNFGEAMAGAVAATPEWFDVTLILSTLHWINSDEFLRHIASMSGKVIVEIPDLADRSATGQKFMARLRKYGSEQEYFEHVTGRTVRLLGTVAAHTYPVRKLWVIEGDMIRRTHTPHIDYGKATGVTYFQRFKGGQLLYVKRHKVIDWIPGINMATLRAMGVTWPSAEWWLEKVRAAKDELDMSKVAGDLRIHNMIVSRGKLSWIDLDHHPHRTTIFEDTKDMVKNI